MSDTSAVSDRIHAWIKRALSECELLPGDPLRQDHIARKFRTSKPPVREALRRLEALQYLEFKPNRGFFVKRFTREEIVDLFEMVALYEGHAVQTGASRLSRGDLAQLDACVKRIARAGDLVALLKADSAFHLGLIGGVRSATLKTRVETFHDYFRMYYRATVKSDLPRHTETYRAILADLRQGNIVAASARVQVHLMDQGRRLSALAVAPPTAAGADTKPLNGPDPAAVKQKQRGR